ncbi:MAG: helix-turn-helix domain-containing protein [Desulfotignum sp.]|nr:helix-turn-helix domain-containing protein [Desulfobacteraceae bacterium]
MICSFAEKGTVIGPGRSRAVDYDELTHTFRMSRRSLERRFKQATGMTPLSYLQKLCVEKTRQLLEEGIATFSDETW